MAYSASMKWNTRPGGNDNNGGGYSTGGTNYSLQDSPQLTVTDAAATGTTNLSSATGGFTSQMVGSVVNVVGQARREITAFVNTNNVTCDSAWATFSGATANVGGATATPGTTSGLAVTGNTIQIMLHSGSPYTTSGSANVSGGRISISTSGVRIVGYITTPGDITTVGGTRPIINAANSSAPITLGAGNIVENLIIDGVKATYTTTAASLTGSTGFNVTARNCNAAGFAATSSCLIHCEADANTVGFDVRAADHCVSKNNTSHGFQFSTNGATGSSLTSHSNGGDGIRVTASGVALDSVNCSNNTGDGLEFSTASSTMVCTNGVFSGNTGYGINVSGSNSQLTGWNNASRSNTAGVTNGTVNSTGAITLTGDPFTNGASDDYTINAASAGGIQLKAAAINKQADGTSIGAPDVGNYQQPSTAGGAASLIGSGLVR